MEQYSETIGSFIRRGNYPLEANYIFNSKEELKEFYKDSINNTQLHEGLFKIVKESDNQTLYWVISINDKLEFVPLIKANSIESLQSRISQLYSEFGNAIWSIVNVNRILDTTTKYENVSQAATALINAGLTDAKYNGVIIAYDTSNGWKCKQFSGNPETEFTNEDKWKDFGSSDSGIVAITQREYDEMKATGTWDEFAQSHLTIYVYEEEEE